MEDSQWTRNVELFPERRVLNDRGKSSKHVRTPPRWSITFIVLVLLIFFHMAWKMTGLDFAFNILRCIWENLILHSQQTNTFVLEMIISPALYSKPYHFFRNFSCSKMSQRKWFRLCTKIKDHAPENTPKILIWPILHGRCFPAKPVAFHWALPAEPYNPPASECGAHLFFSTISPFISLLNPCWRLCGSRQLTCKCPFQKRFLCAAFLWTVGRGDIQGVKGVPPECGSSVMLWHSSFSLGGVLHFRTHFWSSFPKNYNPNTDLGSFIQSLL